MPAVHSTMRSSGLEEEWSSDEEETTFGPDTLPREFRDSIPDNGSSSPVRPRLVPTRPVKTLRRRSKRAPNRPPPTTPDPRLAKFDAEKKAKAQKRAKESLKKAKAQKRAKRPQRLRPHGSDSTPNSTTQRDSSSESESDSDSDTGISVEQTHRPMPPPPGKDGYRLSDYVTIGGKENITVAPRFGYSADAYHIRFKNKDQIGDMNRVATDLFTHLIDTQQRKANDNDIGGVTIQHPELDSPIFTNYMKLKGGGLTAEHIMDKIANAQQSHKNLSIDSDMLVTFTKVRYPEGAGYTKMKQCVVLESIKKKAAGHGSSIIEITNDDNLCLFRAVVTAKARHQYFKLGDHTVKWDSIKRGDKKKYTLQKRLAEELKEKAGLGDLDKKAYGVEEFPAIQRVLEKEGFALKIFAFENNDDIIFKQETPGLHQLYLYNYMGHFDVMSSPCHITGTNFFCDDCNKGYDHPANHRCEKICPDCRQTGICEETASIVCTDCRRRFKSQQCFDNHKTQPTKMVKIKKTNKSRKISTPSVCQKIKKCDHCGRQVPKCKLPPAKHHCGERYCPTCTIYVKLGVEHQCYMQPLREKKSKEGKDEEMEVDGDDLDALVREEEDRQGETDASREEHFRKSGTHHSNVTKFKFFDFETTQQDEYKKETRLGPAYLHKPNCCVVRSICMLCKDFWLSQCENPECRQHSCEECQKNKPNCAICGDNSVTFRGEDCIQQFCAYLFQGKHKGTIAIAHNAKGFDVHFIINWLMSQKREPKTIAKGLKVIGMGCMGIKIIDSHSFLSQSLASLPKTFNIPELKKGYFPYLFSTRENENYVGPYPDADCYCPSSMKPADREKFYKWYNQHKDGIFDYEKELREYTESDVDILSRCALTFNDLFHGITGIYPLENDLTIASACMRVFRTLFLKENTIGIIPTGGYRGNERQSEVAMEWLKWYSQTNDVEVQHARNGKEKQIGKYKVDGFHGDTVLEFHGCVYHGCPRHYPHRQKKLPFSQDTYDDVYKRTKDKKDFLEAQGYKVLEMWECDWKGLKRTDPEVMDFVKSLDKKEFLEPRSGLAGGRTNATRLYHKCSGGETIQYMDFCSLYPWVCKYCRLPVGHPKVITEGFKPILPGNNPYFGEIRCRVLPPRGLFHPVLPYSFNQRLNFALCRVCLETEEQGVCSHSVEDRSFIGTFMSPELDKALEVGYEVLEVYEVWHYEDSLQYDGEDENSGLYTAYINKFLKLKTEATGWPGWVKTEEDKNKYIMDYEKKEGIKLDPDRVERNEGLRATAKLCLNSFWGKFAQRSNLGQKEYVKEPNRFFELLRDPENVVTGVTPLGDGEDTEMMLVSFKKKDEFDSCDPKTNVVLASFVTAYARLKLYSELEKLQLRVLYYDTDSVIFLTSPGDTYMPPIGDFLGDFTDELAKFGEGSYIGEFVSGGPKQYGYTVMDKNGKIVKRECKVKGFTLDYSTAAHINMESMKRQVFRFLKDGYQEEVTVYSHQIRRTKNHDIITAPSSKVQKIVYKKRAVRSNGMTFPFGY